MKNQIKSYVLLFFCLFSLAGCRFGLPAQDWDEFLSKTSEWGQTINQIEQQFADISQKHQAFVDLLEDTTAISVRQRIQSDSALVIQIAQLKNGFSTLQHHHTYHIKKLRILHDESESWIRNSIHTGVSAINVHKFWDAKEARFVRLKEKTRLSESAFENLTPSYQAIRSRVLPN